MKNENLPWWKEKMKLWEYSQWMDELEPSYKISGAIFYPIWYGCGTFNAISIAIGLAYFFGWLP